VCGDGFKVFPSRAAQRFCDISCKFASPYIQFGVRTFSWEGKKLSSADFYRQGIFPSKRTANFLRNTYKIEPEEFLKRSESQNNRCPITKEVIQFDGPYGLNVDHCHGTGKVRGLLSGRANRALGFVNDCPTRLAFYLMKDGDLGEYKVSRQKVKGKCETCSSNVSLCIDHNHSTGQVRGILCLKCNSAVGWLNNSSEECIRAKHYLCT